jgi:hypothetical protein
MSDDSININKNTDIKDKDTDKKFFMILSQTILAFTINIILGSYIVYASKILHVIQLPTRMDKFPYTNTTDVPTTNAANNIVGINYLYTEPPSITKPDGLLNAAAATGGIATTGATGATDSEKVFFMSRQLFYTQIYVDPNNYTRIYDPSYFFSSLYKSDWITSLMFKLIMQQLYSFIYWGLCLFFGFVYGDAAAPHLGWYLYLWETAMMIFGPVLFLLFSVGWSICLFFYSCYCIFMQIFTILNYESDDNGVRKDDPKLENTFKGQQNYNKNSWWWRGFPFFLFVPFLTASGFLSILGVIGLLIILFWYFLLGITFILFIGPLYINWIFSCIINIDTDIVPPVSSKASASKPPNHWTNFGKNLGTCIVVLYFTSIINILAFTTTSATTGNLIATLAVIVIYIIYNIYLVKTNKGKYSTSSLLLSKLEPITYVITYIFINCSAIYGYNVMSGVIVLFLALWGLSNKHKMLFYPAKFKGGIYVNVPNVIDSNGSVNENLYKSADIEISNCYDKPTETNPLKGITELLKNLKGNIYVEDLLKKAAAAGGGGGGIELTSISNLKPSSSNQRPQSTSSTSNNSVPQTKKRSAMDMTFDGIQIIGSTLVGIIQTIASLAGAG